VRGSKPAHRQALHPCLIDIPISFFLKNKLNLQAHDVAEFRLLASLPLYVSFAFGFMRDTWRPFG
jgi:hypothetical protein